MRQGKEQKKGQVQGQQKERSLGQVLLYIVGAACLVYFVVLWMGLGAVYVFQWFWLASGGLLIAFGRYMPYVDKLPGLVKKTGKVLLCLALAVFVAGEGLIIFGATQEPPKGADYVVVLGAKVNGTTPSLSLRYRIDAAFSYLTENENTVAVVSGGQGANEDISEAQAMAESLMEKGIAPERILWEDQSTSTNENLIFSGKVIGAAEAAKEEAAEATGAEINAEVPSVVIVSSDFHIFRAEAIAGRYGYEKVSGLGAKSVPWLFPNYCVREFFAVINDGLKGNLKLFW